MRIQHNIAAINSNRQLASNNGSIGKNLEKLSSGYKINRAGDDAAGLAISEKMRAQITGLSKAQDNANDGISLVQTAEGALTEVHSMLNRMSELATQSSNGTFDNETDRKNLQKEVTSLLSEVDRISTSTNYNGIKLLDGSLSSKAAATSAAGNGATALSVSGDAVSLTTNVVTNDKFVAAGVGAAATIAAAATTTFTVSYVDDQGAAKTKDVTVVFAGGEDATAANTKISAAIGADTTLAPLFGDTAGANIVLSADNSGVGKGKITGITVKDPDASGLTAATFDGSRGSSSQNVGDTTATINFDGTKLTDGSKITIGDKTYQILDDVSKVQSGNIAVQRNTANTGDETLKNLLGALKTNGVTSAVLDTTVSSGTTTGTITVSDVSQIKSAQKGAQITTSSSGLSINNTAAVAGQYTQTIAANTATDSQTLTINYIDEAGKQQSKEVTYTGSAATGTANATAIADAISKDDVLSKLFDVTSKNASGVASDTLTLTSKTAGTTGAQLVAMTTTDSSAIPSSVGRIVATEAKDAGKELSILQDGANKPAIVSGDTVTVDGKKFEFVENITDAKEGNIAVILDKTATTGANTTAKNLAAAMKGEGIDMSYDPSTGKINFKNNAASTTQKGGLSLQIGDTAEDFNKVSVSVDDMSSKSLGISDIDISDQDKAKVAIGKIKNAINSVSSTRGDLGAVQNRLEHTINNLGVAEENMTSAESRIRDTDMAKEMMQYTKNNILIQASQAMLAQANKLPQGVLQLLG